jgi:ubiquitin carboxyl-terminal hydrolase 8
MSTGEIRGLCGLVNFGNTCYMNSAIQCLACIGKLNKYFLKKEFLEDLNKGKPELNLIIQWYKLLLGKYTKNSVISPESFRREIRIVSLKEGLNLNFVGNGQNDVQEFLIFLIDKMHNGVCRKVNINITGEVKNDLDKCALDAMKMWKLFFKDNYSIFIDLFYCQNSSRIYDLDKKILSTNYDPICYHAIPIPEKEEPNIYDCFDLFTTMELIDDKDNLYFNEETKEYIKYYKEIKFWSLPKVLIVVLKRFMNNGNKITKKIDFPLKNLDLCKYCVGYRKKSNVYDLMGVSNHVGSLQGGHYFAYCRMDDGNWYNFNDTSVSRISENEVVTEKAYCLFYMKK